MTTSIRANKLAGLMAALCIVLPATVAASPFTITIQGVDTSSGAIDGIQAAIAGDAGWLYTGTGVYSALGNCDPAPGHLNSCDGTVAIGTNPFTSRADVDYNNDPSVYGTDFSYAAIYGYGQKLDQLILHRSSADFAVTAGVFSPPASGSFAQTFDFVVGSTGGGSAGPYAAPYYFEYEFNVLRDITITGIDDLGNAIDLTQTVNQRAVLHVGWDEDTLEIFESDAVSFNLGASGIIQVRLRAEGPITAGDPEIGIDITAATASVPEPSTLALLGLALGLGGIVRRRVAS